MIKIYVQGVHNGL